MDPVVVKGEGPVPCRIAIIGEAPGPDENRARRPFVGRSGQLLTHYLHQAGLVREEVWISNVYPFWPGPGNPAPTKEEIQKWEHVLIDNLVKVRPSYILALGAVAAEWLLQRPVVMEREHGLAFKVDVSDGALAVVGYHPAAGLHNPRIGNYCAQDVQAFADVVKGKWKPAIDTYNGNTNYRFISRADFGTFGKLDLPAVDTEGLPSAPFCASVSANTGAAGVFDTDTVIRKRNDFQLMLDRGPVLFHNAMWDFAVLRSMMLNTDTIQVIDTRIMAYLLQEASQGLKELAYRYCGMEMQTYEEIATPPSLYKVVRYLQRAGKLELPPSDETLVRDPSTRRYRIKRPHSISTRIKALLTSIKKGNEDPWSRWEGIEPTLRKPVEVSLGPIPPLSLNNASQEEWVQYAGRDPDATRRLYQALLPRIKELELEQVLDLDCAVMPMFEAMQARGMMLDLHHLEGMRPSMVKRLSDMERAFSKRWLKGRPISLNSDDQVAKVLYEEFKLPIIRTTAAKGRGSMDDDTLRLLIDKHPAVGDVLEYAKLSTQLSFVDRLPKWVGGDARIHPTVLITQTVTGRPATKDPNLLNIPTRTEVGRQIRDAFVATPGYNLVEIDLSQIELRVMAHLSEDKRMIQAYQEREDLHQITADANKLTRPLAKTANFALLYLCTGYKLMMVFALEGVNITEERGDEIIAGWYSLYPGVRAYQQRVMREARATGMVRTMSGRIRYLPHARLPQGDPLRAEAERHAVNMPVQGGAADIIKKGMQRIWKWIIENRDQDVHPLLQIYDSLLFEIPKGKEDIALLFRSMMTKGYQLRVPLDAEAKYGERWGSLEKMK